MKSVVTACCAVAAAAIMIGLPAVASAAPAVAGISASPSTGLADGQQVSVSLTGYQPNEAVGVTECATPAGEPEVCDFADGVNFTTDASGGSTGQYTVHATWTGTDPLTGHVIGPVDCTVSACTIAGSNPTTQEAATAAISFN